MNLPVKLEPKEGELIYQSNAITDGVYKITLDEFRLLNLAISKITRGDHPEKRIRITTKEFVETFNLKDKNIRNRLSSIADGLIGKTIDTYSIDSETGKRTRRRRLWLSEVAYDEGEDNIFLEVIFSTEVSELLFQLKGNFTLFALKAISAFTSPNSFRIYAWICKYRNMDFYRNGEIITTDTISLRDFKTMLSIENSYEEYKFLKQKIIERSLNEINAFTDISVVLNEFKTTRKVTAISFSFVEEDNPTLQAIKPRRKRLPSRPKVNVGSHAEGEWARKCIDIILEYERALKEYDQSSQLPISDLEKLVTYYNIIGVTGDVSSLWSRSEELERRRSKK
ncbi:replication initiation protein (plasmid) [Edwardsiella tarda]|uniref:replication initiation protein n=1 Tax=Edwardsiella tarda TaxID=636 RepID=UPI000D50965F|nr:replication initiation protein [Edwardsiella tarda]UCQ29616.1 replication initiation protein [Edwardsiella tarda]